MMTYCMIGFYEVLHQELYDLTRQCDWTLGISVGHIMISAKICHPRFHPQVDALYK